MKRGEKKIGRTNRVTEKKKTNDLVKSAKKLKAKKAGAKTVEPKDKKPGKNGASRVTSEANKKKISPTKKSPNQIKIADGNRSEGKAKVSDRQKESLAKNRKLAPKEGNSFNKGNKKTPAKIAAQKSSKTPSDDGAVKVSGRKAARLKKDTITTKVAAVKLKEAQSAASQVSNSKIVEKQAFDQTELFAEGKAKGYLTLEELGEFMPEHLTTADQIEDWLDSLGEEGIQVVDARTKVRVSEVSGPSGDSKKEEDGAALSKLNDPVRMY
ncbi:MAG: RNA polymerase sigma factor region1.1 domain-containing protein, partial [Pseudomonadota bacterium]